jgi:hypothetical protein
LVCVRKPPHWCAIGGHAYEHAHKDEYPHAHRVCCDPDPAARHSDSNPDAYSTFQRIGRPDRSHFGSTKRSSNSWRSGHCTPDGGQLPDGFRIGCLSPATVARCTSRRPLPRVSGSTGAEQCYGHSHFDRANVRRERPCWLVIRAGYRVLKRRRFGVLVLVNPRHEPGPACRSNCGLLRHQCSRPTSIVGRCHRCVQFPWLARGVLASCDHERHVLRLHPSSSRAGRSSARHGPDRPILLRLDEDVVERRWSIHLDWYSCW